MMLNQDQDLPNPKANLVPTEAQVQLVNKCQIDGQATLFYHLSIAKPQSRMLEVELVIPNVTAEAITCYLPAWLLGSYKIRDFAQYLVSLKAIYTNSYSEVLQSKIPAVIKQIDKATWEFSPASLSTIGNLTLSIKYKIYCSDDSPRGAWISRERCFLQLARVLLCVQNYLSAQQYITWDHNYDYALLTSYNFKAASYYELIEHPVYIGPALNFSLSAKLNISFGGSAQVIALLQQQPEKLAKLTSDIAKLCQVCDQYFTIDAATAANQNFALDSAAASQNFAVAAVSQIELPVYWFCAQVFCGAYGGLEQANASSLHISLEAVLSANQSTEANQATEANQSTEANQASYIELLGLFSHEYLHRWLVKRLKPSAFLPENLDLTSEVYTEQLWFFEGVTAYLDDKILLMADLISEAEYLALIARNWNNYINQPGAKIQPLAAASFEAWTKFYQQPLGANNFSISYYLKGSLFAHCLDLQLQLSTDGARDLRYYLLVLWQDYQQQLLTTGGYLGLQSDSFEQLVAADLSQYYPEAQAEFLTLFKQGLYGTSILPLLALLKKTGVIVRVKNTGINFGFTYSADPNSSDGVLIKTVCSASVAADSGLLIGDRLLAINNIVVTASNLESLLPVLMNQTVAENQWHIIRQQELLVLSVCLDNAKYLDGSNMQQFTKREYEFLPST